MLLHFPRVLKRKKRLLGAMEGERKHRQVKVYAAACKCAGAERVYGRRLVSEFFAAIRNDETFDQCKPLGKLWEMPNGCHALSSIVGAKASRGCNCHVGNVWAKDCCRFRTKGGDALGHVMCVMSGREGGTMRVELLIRPWRLHGSLWREECYEVLVQSHDLVSTCAYLQRKDGALVYISEFS